jgi:UDP-N-acetylglucosamine 1-carboxyvinyltransferase
MSKFVITGGKKLNGSIAVSGSKNSVLPLMAACLLTEEECVLTNVPDIKDVETMIHILKDLGCQVDRQDHRLTIKASGPIKHNPDAEKVGKFRGSILLIGALLARLGKAALPFPGGDKIGKRPIDTHVEALEALGATAETNHEMNFVADKLTGTKIVLGETSVTATENLMMAASLAEGQTVIKLAAMEPHVQQLGQFLNLMGAKVQGFGTPTIIIDGVSKLHGATIKVIPDSEEAASLITLAAATKSDIKVTGLNPEFLEDFLLRIKKMNVNFEVGEDYVHIKPPQGDYVATKIQCGLYPKLNSDFMPPMSVLATQARGESLVYEWLYENRLGYVAELKKMGADAEILDPHRVRIVGPSILHGETSTTYDLRMGITLVIAALVATGESQIHEIHHVDRGYENLEARLKNLDADIKRVDE